MLVPALSLPDALVAIIVGCLIGNVMLATAGMIGAAARVPGMALMRAPLGQRGSLLPTTVNVAQGVGWTIFELLVIATAAAALSDALSGFRAQWLWTIVFGACALVLALLGPIGFVRRFIRRFAIWAVPLALGYLTWWALDGADRWVDVVAELNPPDWGIGATVPSFLVSFLAALAVALVTRRHTAGAATT